MLRFGPARASSRTTCALRGREQGRSLAYDALAVQFTKVAASPKRHLHHPGTTGAPKRAPRLREYAMKEEYDFSKGERGKFYRPDAELDVPVYLDSDVRDYIEAKAKSKGVEVKEIVNDLLRKEIALIEGVK